MHVPGTDGQIQRIPNYELFPYPACSSDLAPMTIFCFQTWRNSSEEKDLPPESSSLPKQNPILIGLDESYYSGWLEKVGESLDQVYRAEKRIYWEIKMNW